MTDKLKIFPQRTQRPQKKWVKFVPHNNLILRFDEFIMFGFRNVLR